MPSYTTYGPWIPNPSTPRRARIRIDWSIGTPAVGASSVAVSVIISLEAGYGFYWRGVRYSRSGALGDASSSIGIQVATGGSVVLERLDGSLPIYSSGAYMVSLTASASGIGYIGGGTVSHTSSVPLPGQAGGIPGRPAPQARYVSDDQAVVSWGATDLADRYYVERWDEGNQRWDKLGSTADTSVTDYGLRPNNRYKWRVCASAAGGYESAWAETGGIRTTPNPPALSVARSGGTIMVTLAAGAAYPQHWQLERQVNGGAWTYWTQSDGRDGQASMATGSGDTVRIRGRSGVSEGGQRWSQWAYSDVVVAPCPPNAPSLLAPTQTIAGGQPVAMRWRHNPRDLTAQQGAEVRYRRVEEAAWVTVTTTTASQVFVDLPLGLWQWQARTRGEYAEYGPWSGVQGFLVATPPTVLIRYPAQGSTVSAARITPEVDWYDGRLAPMVAWRLVLRDYDDDRVLWSGAGSGRYQPLEIPIRLANRHSYRVEIAATSGTGLSAWEQNTFTTEFKPPAPPTLVAHFSEADGAVIIDASTRPATGDQPPTSWLRVEGSYDGGVTWILLRRGTEEHVQVVDALVPLGQEVSYRAVAESDLPSEAESAISTLATQTCRLWVTARDLARRVWCEDNLKIDAKYGAEKVLETYEGRSKPMVHLGAARPVEISLDGDLFPDGGSPLGEWLALLDQDVWVRSPRRHRVFGTLTGEIRTSDVAGSPATSISLTVTETEVD